MKLLWIGSPFFCPVLQNALNTFAKNGQTWEVISHNFEELQIYDWNALCALANGEPDVLVVADKSRPPFVIGMERFPCLTVFYCVDSHIHSWYPFYAQGFDICLLSLSGHKPLFEGNFLPSSRIWPSPAFAKENDRPNIDGSLVPEWDVVFVGNVDKEKTPQRARFLHELQQKIPGLMVMRGNYRLLYPRARLVLNFCEFGDLNFRVFEALGCGAALVTPYVGHGFARMFTEGKDLLCYDAKSPDDAARVIGKALENERMRQELATCGLATVDAGHRSRHRAESFAQRLFELAPDRATMKRLVQNRCANAQLAHASYLKILYLLLADSMEVPALREVYLDAARDKRP